MKCPVCKNQDYVDLELRTEGFSEGIKECRVCGSQWAVQHGLIEIIRDSQANSFLSGSSEKVESDDYNRGV